MCTDKRGVFMRKNIGEVFLIILLILCAFPFVYYSNIKTQEATKLKMINYQQKLEVSGVIEAAEQIEMTLSYPVYIEKSFVNENSYVNKGQLLFTLDEEKMKNAVKNYNFTDIGVVNYNKINIDKENFTNMSGEIYATESGYVREIAALDGNMVLSDEKLCVIENSDKPILRITVPQEEYSNIQVGDKIQFKLAVAPARNYSGTISDKTAVVRKETSLTGNKTVIDIFADIDCTDEYIYQGLQFTGTITKDIETPIYTLPYEFVNQDNKGVYVNIYKNGTVVKKYIETGIETENEVEILTMLDKDTVFLKNIIKGKIVLENDI